MTGVGLLKKLRHSNVLVLISASLAATFIYFMAVYIIGGRIIVAVTNSVARSLDQTAHAEKRFIYKNSTLVRKISGDVSYELAAIVNPDVFVPAIKDGLAPAIRTLDTKQNVVFLGIDDGAYKNPKVIESMKKHKIKASLYLADRFINDNYDFFKDMVSLGSKIENHTLHHRLLPQISYEEQKAEICGMADLEEKIYGRRPTLFRPPGGDYNTDTQKAAAACGMKAIVLWIAKANGGSMQYQGEHKLHKGDIVLMHFRPEFEQDMQAFVDAQNEAGLKTVLLDKWIK